MGDMLQEDVNVPVLYQHVYQLARGHSKPLSPKALSHCLRHNNLTKQYGSTTTFCTQNQRKRQNLDFVILYAVYVHSVHRTHPDEFTIEKRNKILDSGRILDGTKLALRQLRRENILRYFKKLLTRRPQAVWKAASSAQSRTAYLEWDTADKVVGLREQIRQGETNSDVRGRLLHFLFFRLWKFILPDDPRVARGDKKRKSDIWESLTHLYKTASRNVYRNRPTYSTFRTDLPTRKGSPPAQLLDAKGRKHTHARISNLGRRIRRVLRNKKKQTWLGYRAEDHMFKAYLDRKVDRWFRRQFRRHLHPIDRNFIRRKLKG